MTAADAYRYLGMPYKDDGDSEEEGFNCWGFLRHVSAKHFGKHLPIAPLGDGEKCIQMHTEALHDGVYEVVRTPSHGDAVLLRGGDSPHVGIWLDIDGGGVLHSMTGYGVIWTPKANLAMLGFSKRQYYRLN